MKPVVYRFSIGGSSGLHSNISRVYTLLMLNRQKGKKYGFQYIPLKSMLSINQDKMHTSVMADVPRISHKEDKILLYESNVDSIALVMDDMLNLKQLVPYSPGTFIKKIVAEKGTKSEAKIPKHMIISNSVVHKLSNILDSAVSANSYHSLVGLLDKDYTYADNSHLQKEIIIKKQLIFDKYNSSYALINESNSVAEKAISRIMNIDRTIYTAGNIGSISVVRKVDVLGKGLGSTAFIDYTKVYSIKYSSNALIDETVTISDVNSIQGESNLKARMFDKDASRDTWLINDIAKESRYASRYAKYSILNRIVVESFRTGKTNVMINRADVFADRNEIKTSISRSEILSDINEIEGTINRNALLYDKYQRKGKIYESLISATTNGISSSGSPSSYGDEFGKFTFASRIFGDSEIYDPHTLAEKFRRNAQIDYVTGVAVSSSKQSHIRLYNTFDARVVRKVVYSDRALKPSIFFAETDTSRADRGSREAIIVYDMAYGDQARLTGEVIDKYKMALSKGCDAITMIGLGYASNVGAQSYMLISNLSADEKDSTESIVGSIKEGHGKLEHNSQLDQVIVSESGRPAYESILHLIGHDLLGIDISKDRLSQIMDGFYLMSKLYEQRVSLNHSLMYRAERASAENVEILRDMKLAEWDTEWSDLVNITIESKDRYDRIKVPNDDFDFNTLADKVYNRITGIPLDPIGDISKPEVEVKLPVGHYNSKFSDLVREEIPVDLYVYKDMMLLIWIFWCKHRGTEKTAEVLGKYYETENIDMARLNAYSQLIHLDAQDGLNYVLDKVREWIDRSIAYFDPEKKNQYERVMKQVRWFGEKIATSLSSFVIDRKFSPSKVDFQNLGKNILTENVTISDRVSLNKGSGMFYIVNHKQPIDGEIWIDAHIKHSGKLTIIVDNNEEDKIIVTDEGIYMNQNPTLSEFLMEGIKIPLPVGSHDVKILLEGNPGSVDLLGVTFSDYKFEGAKMKYKSKPGRGSEAIDRLLKMMYDYYEIHHYNKAKGERSLWVSE